MINHNTENKEKHRNEHDMILVMKSWRKNIPKEQRNIIIAFALNHCVNHENFDVIGYFISERKIFLMILEKEQNIASGLAIFYEQVALGIFEYYKKRAPYYDEIELNNENHHELFEKHPFLDDNIKRLIIGEPITLPYYNPKLARLKDKIANTNFCSTIDYSGAVGPVIVNTNYNKTAL